MHQLGQLITTLLRVANFQDALMRLGQVKLHTQTSESTQNCNDLWSHQVDGKLSSSRMYDQPACNQHHEPAWNVWSYQPPHQWCPPAAAPVDQL